MRNYIVQRLMASTVVLLLVSLVVFLVILLIPGDPTLDRLGPDAPVALRQAVLTELGLDRPIPVQYLDWLSRALRGDLGRSFSTRELVLDAIRPRLLPTVELAALGLLISLAIALPLGCFSALAPRSALGFVASLVSTLGMALPSFWLAFLLVWLFSLHLRLLPPAGYVSIFSDPVENLKLMILPACTLGTSMAAIVTRMLRSSLLEVLGQDYVLVARAKGLTRPLVLGRHALKSALLPVVTVVGLQASRLIGGAVIVETVFSIPGVGRLVVEAIRSRDFPRLQGAILVIVVGVLLVNLIVDLIYARINPRIRYG